MPLHYGEHCKTCPYRDAVHLDEGDRQLRQTPLSMEDNGSDVLLIFQAPGRKEWEEGRPTCSTDPRSAGGRLIKAFKDLGSTRGKYNITNIVQCFPGKEIAAKAGKPRDKKPDTSARNCCTNWLSLDIGAREYRQIVVFGREAEKAVGALGFAKDSRFKFCKHPTGGLKKSDLVSCLS